LLTIDSHQHFWPEPLIGALSRSTEAPRLRNGSLELAVEGALPVDLEEHDLARRLALLDRHDIDTALISLAPTMEVDGRHDLIEAYHLGMLEIAAASNGRLRPLAYGECREEFVGTCVSALALVNGIEPLLSELEAAGQMLFVHPGPPTSLPSRAPRWWAAVAEYTRQMQSAFLAWVTRDAERHARLPVVFAILAGGGPIQLERLGSRGVEVPPAARENAYFDTASYGRRALELCVAAVGSGQLVFGSDAPTLDPGAGLRAVAELGHAFARSVCGDNPTKVLA
jgi:6-methylsalicylate decarboxylase